MAAFATLTVPVTLSSTAQREAALKILNSTPGATDAVLGTDSATLKLQLPGNIDALIGRLASKHLAPGATIGVSIPVELMVPEKLDPTRLIADLNSSPAISGAAFDGVTVTAQIVAATTSIRYMFEEIEVNGLMPIDHPTPAGSLEFVL